MVASTNEYTTETFDLTRFEVEAMFASRGRANWAPHREARETTGKIIAARQGSVLLRQPGPTLRELVEVMS